MRSIFSMLILLVFAALPAKAVTVITTNGDAFAIGAGDLFDHVVMFDTSTITMSGGSVSGHFLMLDQTVATFTGGTVGDLTVLGNAVANVVIQSGTLDVDGVPTPEPTTLDTLNCPACTVSAILANGDPVGPTPVAALQAGTINVTAVPEPHTALMFLLGLLGLAWPPLART